MLIDTAGAATAVALIARRRRQGAGMTGAPMRRLPIESAQPMVVFAVVAGGR